MNLSFRHSFRDAVLYAQAKAVQLNYLWWGPEIRILHRCNKIQHQSSPCLTMQLRNLTSPFVEDTSVSKIFLEANRNIEWEIFGRVLPSRDDRRLLIRIIAETSPLVAWTHFVLTCSSLSVPCSIPTWRGNFKKAISSRTAKKMTSVLAFDWDRRNPRCF